MAKQEEKTVKVLFIRNTFMDGNLMEAGSSMECKEGMARMLINSKKAYAFDSEEARTFMKSMENGKKVSSRG